MSYDSIYLIVEVDGAVRSFVCFLGRRRCSEYSFGSSITGDPFERRNEKKNDVMAAPTTKSTAAGLQGQRVVSLRFDSLQQSKELDDTIQAVGRHDPSSWTTQSKQLDDTIQAVGRHNPRSWTTQSKELYHAIQGVVAITFST